MADFADSPFRFTSPVRFFKANDPIYYEVDNIPLKQLHENDLWLKDQIQKLANPGVNTEGEIDRTLFSELKPYSEGTDNIIKVRPGRFTARINDAYSITPLQYIQNISGSSVRDYDTWLARSTGYGTVVDSLVSGVIERFRANILSDSLNMNGLTERAFSYPSVSPNRASTYLSPSAPIIAKISQVTNDINQPLYPLRDNQLIGRFTTSTRSLTDFIIKQYDTENVTVGFAALSTAEPEFIKRWRGVARTAVVDVAQELSIEIPPFNVNDFFYINENNQKVNLTNASQRIDLLFIYAKPVDADSTTIAKYVSTGQPTTITAPALGIVYGAGVGMNYTTAPREFKNIVSGAVLADSNVGSLKMLPHIGDEAGQNNGFKIGNTLVKGSFPSPDDLMNLTPILDEQLSTNHYGLIGQSILPIAYIVVKKAASNNANQVNIINNSDIIDIRPFFRTTELSYNERAGLAAAVPAPSLANPVVTQSELKYELNRAIQSVYSNPPTSTSPTGTGTTEAAANRILGMGYIFGGLKYGPEGVFANSIASNNPDKDITDIMPVIRNLCSIPSSIEIPILPDWDKAEWVKSQGNNLQGAGSKINDRINIFSSYYKRCWYHDFRHQAWYEQDTYDDRVALYKNTNEYPYKYNTTRKSDGVWEEGTGWSQPLTNPPRVREFNTGAVSFFWFVRKKFYINLPDDIQDYIIDAKLFNCLSHTTPAYDGNSAYNHAPNSADCIWIEKGIEENTNNKYFIINVAFPAKPVGEIDWNVNTGGGLESHHNDYNGYSHRLLNLLGMKLDSDSDETLAKDNNIRAVSERRGVRPNSIRDVGELTALWLAVNEKVIRTPYANRENRGMIAMGICNYPSIMFSIIGIRNASLSVIASNNETPIIDFGSSD